MVLIISQSRHEATTNDIIDWLSYNGTPFIRINGKDFFNTVQIKIDGNGLQLCLPDVNWKEIKLVWFRRWIIPGEFEEIFLEPETKNTKTVSQINKFIGNEMNTLAELFFQSIPKNKLFEPINPRGINKLRFLVKASELGLEIPKTYVGKSKNELLKFLNKEIITKAISDAPTIEKKNENYAGYTIKYNKNDSKSSFSHSLFQEKIEKKYEIRTFIWKDSTYSMAIFSQKEKQTSVDFRKYIKGNPNRTIPFKLPEEIEIKLKKLLSVFKLKTGSFDLIMTTNDTIVMLELNPAGQFGMVSLPCNYYIEKQIADYMKSKVT